MSLSKTLFLAATCLFTVNCFAQLAPPKTSDLTIVNRKLSFSTDGSLNLDEADNAGFAWINNKQFKSGTIELDVKKR